MFIKNRIRTDYIIILPTKTNPDEDIGFKELDRRDRNKGAVMCGSHYIIKRDGMVETSREVDQRGNRRRKYNATAVFVDIVGKDENFTQAQLEALPDIEDELRDLYPPAELLDLT
jgi:N-acetyl-anhydromuramyl-L-alanine amidase AmpD